MEPIEVLESVDLELLHTQKETLLVVLSGLSSPREVEHLNGILTLLDNIEDALDPPSDYEEDDEEQRIGTREMYRRHEGRGD